MHLQRRLLFCAFLFALPTFAEESEYVALDSWPTASWIMGSAKFPPSYFYLCSPLDDAKKCLEYLMRDYRDGGVHPFREYRYSSEVNKASMPNIQSFPGIPRLALTNQHITEIRKLLEKDYPYFYGLECESNSIEYIFQRRKYEPSSLFSRTKFVLIKLLLELNQTIKNGMYRTANSKIINGFSCAGTNELLRNIEYFLVAYGVSQEKNPGFPSILWTKSIPFSGLNVEFGNLLQGLLNAAAKQSGPACSWMGTEQSRRHDAINAMQ